MAIVAHIGYASAFFLAQFVNASSTFIIAIHGNSDTAVPVHVDHLKSLGMPDMGLHPSVSPLSYLIKVQQIAQLSAVAPTFGAFELAGLFRPGEVAEGLQADADWYSIMIMRHGSTSHVLGEHLVLQL